MEYMNTLLSQKKKITLITLTFVVVCLLLSLLLPLEYSATNRLLVIQPTNINLDAYNATKSVERIGDKLSEVVYTTSFFDKVMSNDSEIDRAYFKTKEQKKRKQWAKMVETRVLRGSGMIQVSVYHTDKVQAARILRAIGQVFHTSGWEYVGSMNIQINEIDSPLISTWPVRPNFLVNGFVGLIFGFVVSCVYVMMSARRTMFRDMMRRFIQSLEKIDGALDDRVFENHMLGINSGDSIGKFGDLEGGSPSGRDKNFVMRVG